MNIARQRITLGRAGWRLAVLGLLLANHCSSPPPAGKNLSVLEERLLQSAGVTVRFHITTEGALSVDLAGEVFLTAGNRAGIRATGQFAGETVELELRSDEESVTISYNGKISTTQTPPHLREAIIIGLTRMGLLHNLARLTSGALPDHSEGGVTDWVRYEDLTGKPPEEIAAHMPMVGFSIVVDGTDSGSAWLQADRVTWVPKTRWQTVEFPDGEMKVTERYEQFDIVAP